MIITVNICIIVLAILVHVIGLRIDRLSDRIIELRARLDAFENGRTVKGPGE